MCFECVGACLDFKRMAKNVNFFSALRAFSVAVCSVSSMFEVYLECVWSVLGCGLESVWSVFEVRLSVFVVSLLLLICCCFLLPQFVSSRTEMSI